MIDAQLLHLQRQQTDALAKRSSLKAMGATAEDLAALDAEIANLAEQIEAIKAEPTGEEPK